MLIRNYNELRQRCLLSHNEYNDNNIIVIIIIIYAMLFRTDILPS